jgi:hypothetical protein
MSDRFDYFVIFAEMRTGSNLLEATLGQLDGLTCHGEAFNPDHIGAPGNAELLGVTLVDRLKDPSELLARIRGAEGLNGFRFFFDHEPRVLDALLNDPRCAKIILTRNPVDCYISLKIAYNTKRWKLTDIKDRVAWKPPFKKAEFEAFLADRQAFQLRLLNGLQTTGQTAFYLDYEDTLNLDVLNGLARFLGLSGEITAVSDEMLRQNPEEMADKVQNFPEMETALANVDWANLSRTPNFEPRRGPGVPRFVASKDAPLLYMPIPPNRDLHLTAWLSAFGNGGLIKDFNQKTLRTWKRKANAHRSFAVVRHPLLRAHDSFGAVLTEAQFADIRHALRMYFDVGIPPDDAVEGISAPDYRAALTGFLDFVTKNLNGQTAYRQDVQWSSQWSILKGFADFAVPDMVCREETLEQDLTYLTQSIGLEVLPPVPPVEMHPFFELKQIYSADLERAARDAYQRDFMTFGYSAWKPVGEG